MQPGTSHGPKIGKIIQYNIKLSIGPEHEYAYVCVGSWHGSNQRTENSSLQNPLTKAVLAWLD